MDDSVTGEARDVTLFDNGRFLSATPFDDGKDPQALRTIGEVAKALGIRAHVLRYWEEQFPSLQPIKRSGNRRYYRPEDIALIVDIDRLVHREGYTLRGAAKAIGSKSADESQSNSFADANNPEGMIPDDFFRRLAVIRGELAAALERA